MFEVSSMVPESLFEWCFSSTKISFKSVIVFNGDLCFIRNVIHFKLCNIVYWVLKFFVVWQYNRFYVSHTAVTNLNHIAVEYFAHRTWLWELILESFWKRFTHIRFDVYWKCWVKPYYFVFTFPFCNFILRLLLCWTRQ